MDLTEVKHEFPVFDNQCRVCLSAGRKLTPLGVYKNVFNVLISEHEYRDYFQLDSILLCWECTAVLRKVLLFQQLLHKGHEAFLLGQYLYCSLSHLTTVILNESDPHTVYIHEAIQTNKEKHNDDENHHLDDESLGDDDQCNDVKIEDAVVEAPATDQKKRKNNRWATKKALQNKKPKFKIITDYTEDSFRKIQIRNDELLSYLKKEKESEYFKSKKYKCNYCVLSFFKEKSLVLHNNKYHNKINKYICDICGSRFPNKRHLSRHISEHYYKNACNLCEFVCHDKSQMALHHHRKHRKIFQCIKCGLKFGNRKDFFKHYKEWHEKFICDYCGVSFKMRYCIKDHLRKQHSPFECKTCNKRFARYNGLWLHNKTSHSATSVTAYCVECDRQYPDIYRYKWHLANSARHKRKNKTRVQCPGCDKVFSKNIYMKDHYNLVHLKFFKYRCELCNKNFIRNADLVKHRRRIHEGILPPKNKICYLCGRGFTTNKILTNHVRTHTGERPHACLSCGARFAQSTALRAHQRALHDTINIKQIKS